MSEVDVAASVPGDGSAVERDPWAGHFLRFLGVYFLVVALNVVLVGFILLLVLLDRTGRRKRDLILVFVPLVGAVVAIQTVWRSTARFVYWSPRADRQSRPLQGGARTAAIAGGWILGALMIGLAVVGVLLADPTPEAGWTTEERESFISEIEGEEVDRETATCVVARLEERYPDGPETLPEDGAALESIGAVMFEACSR